MIAENLSDLLQRDLELAYEGERHLIKVLPKMAEAASSRELKAAFAEHLQQTIGHVERLEKVFLLLKRAAAEETYHALRDITSEGEKLIKHIDRSPLLDAALIATANQVEHNEIALYGTMHALAGVLGLDSAAGLLEQTLEEEKRADLKLTQLSRTINERAVGIQNTLKGPVVI